ncbi:fumarylacetoacetase [Edaphobacter albus]|uniref:fumarylacetoacetase n=1 Tax=Edaphobacter sp. 4G125 TaxID=2763071 RepID=UPI001648888F|nr:fumarylacetoacetase [Edaphobacter sp. 4G125]QNI35672.1 fumarylacetoacetase [Edaphobacter sp. 4G125]
MAKQSSWVSESWIASANDPDADFPLTHLPYGAFKVTEGQHLCVAIGSSLVDLYQCAQFGLFPKALIEPCCQPVLNPLMSLGTTSWMFLRDTLTNLLRQDAPSKVQKVVETALYPISEAVLLNPVNIPNYTDFYASIHHAYRVGELFRPDQPLLPNYKYVPIAYHGRASSIITSNTSVARPRGQLRPGTVGEPPAFLPTNALDFELELAFYVGQSNLLGSPILIDRAQQYIFGLSLLNDWSARDIQAWEYQPLGPFLGKNFATTISPWITPIAALVPFRSPASLRQSADPQPLPYLTSSEDQKSGAFDITLEAYLLTPAMREQRIAPFRIGQSNSQGLYWTVAQMIAHHTSNGCNLQVGDVIATGTISGRDLSAAGCLLELTKNGRNPLLLPTGETRVFLQDNDEVILRGSCARLGYPRIGLGECCGKIISPHSVD